MENKSENSTLKINSRRDARALAFHFLYAAESLDYSVSLEHIVENFRTGFDLEIPEDSISIKMAQGAIDLRQDLDAQIEPLLKNWQIGRLGCCTLLILRLAIWELMQQNPIPSVVINEAIELAKNFAEKDSYKFINGILDEYCKKMNIHDEDKESEKSEGEQQ